VVGGDVEAGGGDLGVVSWEVTVVLECERM
jgi:hypothetical protein